MSVRVVMVVVLASSPLPLMAAGKETNLSGFREEIDRWSPTAIRPSKSPQPLSLLLWKSYIYIVESGAYFTVLELIIIVC